MVKLVNENLKTIAAEAAEWLLTLEDTHGEEVPAVRQSFLKWLKMSPLHIEEFLYVSNVFYNIKHSDLTEFIAADGDESQMGSNIIHIFEPDNRQDDSKQTNRTALILKTVSKPGLWAACGLLVVMFVLLIPQFQSPEEAKQSYMTVVGEQRSIVLEDGSRISMNTQTKIDMHFTDQTRWVKLIEGEAVFEVVKDPLRPFRVFSHGVMAEAIGTSFNVYRKNDTTIVTVVEGQVAVTNAPGQVLYKPTAHVLGIEHVALEAGGQIRVETSGLMTDQKTVDPQKVTAWTSRRLIFEGETLANVIQEMNRYNSNKVLIGDAVLNDRKISGTFRIDDPETLLAFLSKVGSVNVQPLNEGSGWVLYLPCLLYTSPSPRD